MLQITELTSEPKQIQTLTLPDGTDVVLSIEYKPMQSGWFIESITHENWVARNLRIVTSPNMLRQYKNQIPFGLACFVTDGHEPVLQEDFSQARAQLFILTAEEVDDYEEILSGEASA